MSWGIFFAAVHHMAAFLIAGALVTEWITLRENRDKPSVKTLVQADTIYGVFSVVLILVGLLRVCYFEKGSEFYVSNSFFWIKIAAFAVMGVLSLYPTITFFKQAKDKVAVFDEPDSVLRSHILMLIRAELVFLAIAVVTAAFMAKGIGTF